MTIITKQDFITSITSALQYISYYHSEDFISAMKLAYEKEKSAPAKDAILQILTSSKMSAFGHRPLCQDTGIVTVFIRQGMNLRWDTDQTVEEMVNEGVRQAYLDTSNPLRASIVSDPAGKRMNTKDNAPAITHVSLVQGDTLEVSVAAKGGGSENKASLKMLNPSDNITDYILDTVPKMGAGWCPPGVLGIGIGGTADKAMLLAKESLFEPINIQNLIIRGPNNRLEELRIELYEKVNQLGIGAQGLGGLTTVLDVKIRDYPTHAASLPIAIIPNCAANRHIHFSLNGTGSATLKAPDLSLWPEKVWQPNEKFRKVNLNTLEKTAMCDWKIGETLLLSGKILTARDAAHKKLEQLLDNKEPLPNNIDLTNKFIYYVGPVNPVRDEVVGPAGPTTANRMDKYTKMMLEQYKIFGMIGKAERGQDTINLIKENQSMYLIAVGGSAYLVSQAIKKAKVVAFPELGMEAIYEFEVENMPVTVAVDTFGNSIHQEGMKQWQEVLLQK